MRNIAAKYVDTGVTDAIMKHDAYVASKTFTPSNITKWVSTVEHAWAGWKNTVTDPEHMNWKNTLLPPNREINPTQLLTFWKRLLTRTILACFGDAVHGYFFLFLFLLEE